MNDDDITGCFIVLLLLILALGLVILAASFMP